MKFTHVAKDLDVHFELVSASADYTIPAAAAMIAPERATVHLAGAQTFVSVRGRAVKKDGTIGRQYRYTWFREADLADAPDWISALLAEARRIATEAVK